MTDLNSTSDVDEALAELLKGEQPFVLLIMPRDIGNHGPGIPRGHSVLWSRAELVAEWDSKLERFVVVKSRTQP